MFRFLCACSFVLAVVLAPLSASNLSPLICDKTQPSGYTTASMSDTSVHANSCTDFAYPLANPQTAGGTNNWQYGYYTAPNQTPPVLNPSSFQFMTPAPVLDSNGVVVPGQFAGWYAQNFFDYFTSLDAFGGHSNGVYTDLHPIDTIGGNVYLWQPGPNSYCNYSSVTNYNCNATGGGDPRGATGPDSGNFFATRRYMVPDYTGTVAITLQAQKDSRTVAANAQSPTDYVVLDDPTAGTSTVLGSVNVPINYNSGTQTVVNWSGSASVRPGDFIDFIIVPNWDSTQTPAGYADYSSGQFQLATIDSTGIAPVIPEPGTVGLLSAGLIGMLLLSKRRASKSKI